MGTRNDKMTSLLNCRVLISLKSMIIAMGGFQACSALIQYSLNKASFYSVFSQSFPPCRSRYTAIRPSMHSRCWRARQNGGTRRSRPRGRLRVPVGAAPPLQCVRRRAGEAPHQSGGSVIKLDITADGLLHHRLDDRSAEALPFRR